MDGSRREAGLRLATLLGAAAAAFAELPAWLAAGVVLVLGRAGGVSPLLGFQRPSTRDANKGLTPPARPCWFDRALVAALGLLLAVTLFTAVACPPNNVDAVLYHLPRQLQWRQQGSVAHFPTQDYRLTVNPPFAEFVGLHLLRATGTDRLHALPNWLGMILTLAAVSLLARDAGMGRTGQLLAAVFAATIPVGIHEASNGKNDWLVAGWFAVALVYAGRAWTADRFRDVVPAGLALGLLVLTKGTGGVYAAAVGLVGGAGLLVRRPPGWLTAVLIPVIAVGLNLGHWHRNLSAYGSLSGQTFGLGNERVTPAGAVSNLVRNAAMHLALPADGWNAAVERAAGWLHEPLGLSPDDPATTWGGQPFRVLYRPTVEDFATAPVHVGLLVCVLVGHALRAVRAKTARSACPTSAIVIAGLLFCVAFKWQPWHPRLHLPLFAVGGVAVAGWLARSRWLAGPAVGLMLLSAAPALLWSDARPLVGPARFTRREKDDIRCFGITDVRWQVEELGRRLRADGTRSVDLINQTFAPWEYPLALKLQRQPGGVRVGYFYPVPGSPPADPAEAAVDVGQPDPPPAIRHRPSGTVYVLRERLGVFAVYRPLRPGENPGPVADPPVSRFGIGSDP